MSSFTITYTSGPKRDASLIYGDLCELADHGETVWLLDERDQRASPFAVDAAIRAEGFDPSAASRCYYSDGSVVAWCRARLDARPLARVIPLRRSP